MNQLLQRLDELATYYHRKYDLNHGGCCWYAYEIARFCDKHGISYQVEISNPAGDVTIEDAMQLSKLRTNFTGPGVRHVWLKFEEGTVNYGGDETDLLFDWNSLELKHFYRHNEWNNSFECEHKPAIQRAIRLAFKQYTLRHGTGSNYLP